jgi:hypothetical protein
MRYPTDGSGAVTPIALEVGQRIKLDHDRRWWTVRAVTEHFAAVTRQAEFHPVGTLCYSVLDWRNGVRGPCDLIGQGYGDGSYSETECAEMLNCFESGVLKISQRNWVRIEIANRPSSQGGAR